MAEIEIKTINVCRDCAKFRPIGGMKATDAKTGDLIAAGQRECSAGTVSWADNPCTTGEFVNKETPEGN